MQTKVAVIGECMLELRQKFNSDNTNPLDMKMGYGGDTLNTSVYLARHDIATAYITALGDDPMSDWLLDQWQQEGIDCGLVERMAESVPGMYMIDVDDTGERSFHYWRKGSPASRLFDDADKLSLLFKQLKDYSYIYLSGISLAIIPADSLQRLFSYLTDYRESGGKIIFDGNYRPTLWNNTEAAQQAYQAMYRITDIALPTFEDEEMLFGSTCAEEVINAIRSHGVPEIIVKQGPEGCLAYSDKITEFVAALPTQAIDTTAAGDSFNAGYLSARFKGANVIEACSAGHALASKVIQHRGAIIPDC